jgi:osmotically-inducible protein OsmY
MLSEEAILTGVRAALGRAGVDLRRWPIHVGLSEGVLTLQGELPEISRKKRALKLTAAVPGVHWIADQLRLTPASPMGDGAIRDHVRDAMVEEPAFAVCAIRIRDKAGAIVVIQEPPGPLRGEVEASVDTGVVTLDGRVPSLSHKRLAGVLCFWVPGTRDVVNGLEVDPPEEDNDGEIADAVRLILEKDPVIDATSIGVLCRGGVVTLRGAAGSPEQRDMAERDAWYTFGVDDVVSELVLSAEPSTTE